MTIRAVVFLHGYDDDAESWREAARRLAPEGATVHRPTGSVRTADRAAWFETSTEGVPDAAQIVGSLVAVHDEIRKVLVRESLEPHEVALVGFSQGGAMALLWALGRRADGEVGPGQPLGAVVAIGAWLPDVPGIDIDGSVHAERVLIAHGEDDEVVPLPLGRSVAKMLERAGAPVSFVGHEVGHDPTPFAADVRTFLEG